MPSEDESDGFVRFLQLGCFSMVCLGIGAIVFVCYLLFGKGNQ